MFNLLRPINPPTIHRVVDGGRVYCPRARADVDVETCLRCTYVDDLETDEHGGVVEVVCTPSFAALTALDPR